MAWSCLPPWFCGMRCSEPGFLPQCCPLRAPAGLTPCCPLCCPLLASLPAAPSAAPCGHLLASHPAAASPLWPSVWRKPGDSSGENSRNRCALVGAEHGAGNTCRAQGRAGRLGCLSMGPGQGLTPAAVVSLDPCQLRMRLGEGRVCGVCWLQLGGGQHCSL